LIISHSSVPLIPTRSIGLLPVCLLLSCQVKPYAPPPQTAMVDSVEVEVGEFAGRPEAYAVVKGRLSSSAAQLIDARQSRVDRTLVLEVLEQTPRGATLLPDLAQSPPFETRIPIEILGLEPGPCLLYANGIEIPFEIPPLQAVVASVDPVMNRTPAITLVDEFIPIEDTVPLSSGIRAVAPGAEVQGPLLTPMTAPSPAPAPVSGSSSSGTSY
jgi:hypothetical protein